MSESIDRSYMTQLVCAHVYVCMSRCTRRTKVDSECLPQSLSPLCFKTWCLIGLEFFNSVRLVIKPAPESSCVTPQHCDYGYLLPTWLFSWILQTDLGSIGLCSKNYTTWAISQPVVYRFYTLGFVFPKATTAASEVCLRYIHTDDRGILTLRTWQNSSRILYWIYVTRVSLFRVVYGPSLIMKCFVAMLSSTNPSPGSSIPSVPSITESNDFSAPAICSQSIQRNVLPWKLIFQVNR